MRLVNTVQQLVPNIREANRIRAAREEPEESVGVRQHVVEDTRTRCAIQVEAQTQFRR